MSHPATQELLGILKNLKYDFEIAKSPKEIDGLGRCYDKKIVVSLRYPRGGLIGLGEFLHCFAHEVRHALHKNEGLFRSYYKALDTGTIPNMGVAARAENDCHRWGHKFLNKWGVKYHRPFSYKIYDKYPVNAIYGYAAYCRMFGGK